MKHTKKLITLALASVMALGCVSLASCGGDDSGTNNGGNGGNGGGSGTTTSGEGIVKDTSLEGKLFAAYTFDSSSGAATDPFSGEAISSYDWTDTTAEGDAGAATYSSEHAKSGNAFVSGTGAAGALTGLKMATYEGLFDATQVGFSFSYWNWSDTSNSDWNLMIDTDYQDITYGNLSSDDSGYPGSPDIEHSVGRGAYSDANYAAAQDVLTTKQLAIFNGTYAGYNAGLVEDGNDSKPGSKDLKDEMSGTAQFMTVVVIPGESISFYRNGALSYCYISTVGSEDFCLSLFNRDDGDEAYPAAFGGACGYVDDVIVGSGLTAEEVLALYNDQMGASKTMADVTLKSNLNEDEANKAEAEENAIADVATQYKAKLADALASEVSGGAVIVDTSAEKGHVGITSLDNGWWTEIKEGIVVGASGAYMTGVLYNNLDDLAVTETLNCNIQVNGADYGATRGDTEAGWYGDFTIASTGYDSSMFAYDVSGSTVTITYTYDDTNGLVVTYKYVPRLAGEVITGSASYTKSDGTTETINKEYTVPDEIVITYTTAVTGVTSVKFGLISTKTYFMITDVSDMTL